MLHSVDWLLTVARALYWVKEGEIISKSAAADWAVTHAHGDWRYWLPRAKELRLHPDFFEQPETQAWIAELTPVIRAAGEELAQALAGP